MTIIVPAANTSASFSIRFSYPKNGEGSLCKGFEIFLPNVISNEDMWRLGKENLEAGKIKLWEWKLFAQTEKGFLRHRGTSFDLEPPRRL